MKGIYSLIIFLFFYLNIQAQTRITGHSHNDYAQKRPLKTAFKAKMGSIEADVYLWNNTLYVTHEKAEIKANYTLSDLYLKPLNDALQTGKAYPMILLIDIKSQADSTLDEIVKQISRYPIFLPENCPIKFVISGNRPKPERWQYYPIYIQFDGRPTETYTPAEWQRIGIVSQSFDKYTSQKGQKSMDNATFDRMKAAVDSIHAQGKKVRFWATPDKKSVWKALAKMGVDFINTDKPKRLKRFLKIRPLG
jgi:alkaline phosphatase